MADGALACPYCLAAQSPWPVVGTSLMFLNGIDVGQVGVVVRDKWGTCPSDRFLVKMEYEKQSDVLRMVMPRHELYLDVNLLRIPDWVPSVSIEDNARLHERFLCCGGLAAAQDRDGFGTAFADVVHVCWQHRLPLNAEEIWLALQAHGLDPHSKARVVELFEFGTGLLVRTHGRPAIKRKRMPPMSRGRYLTKAERELRLRIFGHC